MLSRAKNMDGSKIPTMVRKVRGWYEKSVIRMVRKIHGTNRPWYEKSGSRENHLCRVAGNTVWSHMTSGLTSALEVC